MPIPVSAGDGVRRQLRKDAVFDRLFEGILDGTFEPGERLRDSELQEWFGVSRTPIRLALDRLGEMRLIESKPNRYTRVSSVAPNCIAQSLQVMIALWSLSARLAFERCTKGEASESQRRFERAADACRNHRGDDASPCVSTMRESLAYLSRLSGNELLADLCLRFGSSLRFQLARQGTRLDVAFLEQTFEGLARAADARDTSRAETIFHHLGEHGVLVEASR
jgi:DNA-binding GntR family transcriptional regulator